jgi:hypothetical protein
MVWQLVWLHWIQNKAAKRTKPDRIRIVSLRPVGRHHQFRGTPPHGSRRPLDGAFATHGSSAIIVRGAALGRQGGFSMRHKDVEYSVTRTNDPGIWKWRFCIGTTVKTGKTATSLELLAMRRAQLQINRALKNPAN